MTAQRFEAGSDSASCCRVARHHGKQLPTAHWIKADMLITTGCGDECPHVPSVERDDWPLDDPKGQPIERVRAIRDDVRSRVETLIDREGWR